MYLAKACNIVSNEKKIHTCMPINCTLYLILIVQLIVDVLIDNEKYVCLFVILPFFKMLII